MVVRAYNPRTGKTEAESSLNLRSVRSTHPVLGQSNLGNERQKAENDKNE